ncbi:type II secretion system ATPase GspE [Sulfidibacter corallicola]|uniref:protein-secreting ATPase n=1 Tax=Sulfidibacter corallicola TaxID=2818388 RepID=A0A8A4TTR9_SULCO|nr:type II secretion system ATPase GspE [Sulfidibacter corallicola]QTD53359.1 type II secretion system ATPase GspE [Sulfidibacter corallicola]
MTHEESTLQEAPQPESAEQETPEVVERPTIRIGRKRFGQYCLERNRISAKDLDRALALQEESNTKIGKILVDMGFLTERDCCQILCEQLGYTFLDPEQYPENVPDILEKIPVKFLIVNTILPLALDEEDNVLKIAVEDPNNLVPLNGLRELSGFELDIVMSTPTDIQDALERYYGEGISQLDKIVDDVDEMNENYDDVEHLKDLASEAPVIRLVNLVISRAVEQRASDIHIEPFEKSLKVRYRIDGVLKEIESPPRALAPAVISRIKIISKLDIAEKRIPQDGRLKMRVLGKEIDFRVSTVPTLHGESVVLRLLDKESVALIELARLGMPAYVEKDFRDLSANPHGIVLVSGPTGSGKTTTLYACLNMLNDSKKKILTVENPVEYQLEGINQIHVNDKVGLTFASGLRTMMRQDPDIIMVGEIRDAETAEVSIQASLTGHMVFSTIHTNDATGAVNRLLDMGIEDYLLTSTLLCVLGQRLVRVICDGCKEGYLPDMGFHKHIIKLVDDPTSVHFYRGTGCKACGQTGYTGRLGIYELFKLDDEVRHLIMSKPDTAQLRALARKKGMRLLREDGWHKVLKGVTSVEELFRVTQESL